MGLLWYMTFAAAAEVAARAASEALMKALPDSVLRGQSGEATPAAWQAAGTWRAWAAHLIGGLWGTRAIEEQATGALEAIVDHTMDRVGSGLSGLVLGAIAHHLRR